MSVSTSARSPSEFARAPAARPAWWVGALATAGSALVPGASIGAGGFGAVEVGPWRSEFRVAVVGEYQNVQIDAARLRATIVSGQFEACPWRIGARWSLAPCAAFEAGATAAEADGSDGASDAGEWFAAGVRVRAGWQPAARLRVEAAIGARFPITRYELQSSSGRAYADSDTVGPTAALSVALGLP